MNSEYQKAAAILSDLLELDGVFSYYSDFPIYNLGTPVMASIPSVA